MFPLLCICSLIFVSVRYHLVLLSAGIIGLSNGGLADTHDKFIESIFSKFQNLQSGSSLHGHSAALTNAAMNILRKNFCVPLEVLKSFSYIPASRLQSIIRLLLCAFTSSNLNSFNEQNLRFLSFQHEFLNFLLSSKYQFQMLYEIVDFIERDSSILSYCVNLNSLYTFFKNRIFERDSSVTVNTLLEASVTLLNCIRKYVRVAKRMPIIYTSKLHPLFAVELFILRLMYPEEIAGHVLVQECIQCFCEILEIAAFPEDVAFLLSDAERSHDLKMNVLLPRPFSLSLRKPLCDKDDLVCYELSLLVQEALMKFPGFSEAAFHSLLKHSKSSLLPQQNFQSLSPSSVCSFHGIYNLGCTCYFNSITQQLFMLPGFAASVIAAQIKVEATENLESGIGSESKSATMVSNVVARGVLNKFQELMIHLRHGTEPVVYPQFFCDSFRFPDGSCILPDVQQDALEYFHILCDHLDNALKGGRDEKLLSRFFGGRSATQLICRGCPHRYERFEHFFTLQLAVFCNRSNSVLSALQEFVSGELLEGDNQYFCSQCNKKVDTVKRTVLADLPDTIILGLKRFDFNYDTMQRIKLNVEVPFSHDLDMAPFCRENLGETPQDSEPVTKRERGYYEYSLVGIVVHSGMADSGHYFSIIRDPEQNGLWHKFNDDTVTAIQNFDVKQFYGGESSGKNVHVNAYILVYQRKNSLFSHPYEQIFSIENEVQQVQSTIKLSTHAMFIDFFKNKSLWQCLNLAIQQVFPSSPDGKFEIDYLDLILKLNGCTSLYSESSVEAMLQPLQVSLRSIRKCNFILKRFFMDTDNQATVETSFFDPIFEMTDPKSLPVFSPLYSNLLVHVFSIIKDCDLSRFSIEEIKAYGDILHNILCFYGNISLGLFNFFPSTSTLDVNPVVVPLAFAVQAFLLHSWQHGLSAVVTMYFSSHVQGNRESALIPLHRMCLVCAHFAHLSELGTKLRSKRRTHLRKLLFDSRHCACLNCLEMLKCCLLEQPFVPVEDLLVHDFWFDCFKTLFSPDFLIVYLYSPFTPIVSSILSLFESLVVKMCPLVRRILMIFVPLFNL
jgi:ubiquitin C-terminal hydrolase